MNPEGFAVGDVVEHTTPSCNEGILSRVVTRYEEQFWNVFYVATRADGSIYAGSEDARYLRRVL